VPYNDYTVTYTASPLSNGMLIHKPTFVSFWGNTHLTVRDLWNLSLYHNVELKRNAEGERTVPTKLHLRAQHSNNAFVSVGVEDLDVVGTRRPDLLSAYGLYAAPLNQGVTVFAGPYLGFRLSSRSLAFHRYLVGVRHSNFTGHLEVGFNRKVTTTTVETATTQGQQTEVRNTTTVTSDRSINLRFDSKVNRNVELGGDLALLPNKPVSTNLFGRFAIDDATFLKVKATNRDTLTLGLTHTYNKFVNFCFVTQFQAVFPEAPRQEPRSDSTTTSTPTACPYSSRVPSGVRTKFGLLVEIFE